MSTALQIKVISVLGYVAISTALVLMLADDETLGVAQTVFVFAGLHG